MKFTKLGRILAGVMLVFCLTVMPTPAHADEEVTGSFEVGGADPTIESLQLQTAEGSPTSSMSPQVEYNIEVVVADANTLDDLSAVTVRIFHDVDNNYTATEEAGAADNQTLAILTWTNGGDPWSIDPVADGTSWVLESGNCSQPDLSAASGTFEFHFKPGKVATETTGSDGWHIYVEADDGDATATANVTGNTMNWYGEITVNAPSSVDWGPLTPGMNFAEASSNWTGISITYIANGPYDEQIAASANWTSGSDNATLDVSGNCNNTNEFSLSADNTTTYDVNNAKLVKASSYETVDDTGTQTTESGDLVTTNTLWLKLSEIFLAQTYSGSIYFKIAAG